MPELKLVRVRMFAKLLLDEAMLIPEFVTMHRNASDNETSTKFDEGVLKVKANKVLLWKFQCIRTNIDCFHL